MTQVQTPATQTPVLMVGAGPMAMEYAKVLTVLGTTPVVMGRGAASAAAFRDKTGIAVGTGALDAQIRALGADLPKTAIVSVNAYQLAEVSVALMGAGVTRLLVEKPAALDLDEVAAVQRAADTAGAEVYVAYNRRFLASVMAGDEIIARDGGPLSVKFDFSEPARRIATLNKPQRELTTWFYGNSTHVLDLAFHFAGRPAWLQGAIARGSVIDPQTGIFSGSGLMTNGCHLSWHANWVAPGRWGVEVLTREHRLIYQPLEKLRVQTHASFAETPVEIDEADDLAFKPGLLRQTRAFLTGEMAERLLPLAEHADMMQAYEAIRTGARWTGSEREHEKDCPAHRPSPDGDDVTIAPLDRLTALIEEAHALGKDGHHAAAVPLFVAARELVLLAVDPAALDKEVQRQTGLHRQEREVYRQDILSRSQPRAGNRPLVILSDSLGLPRPDAKATPRKGAEHIYSDLLAGAGGGLRVDALCQRFFTTSDALALLHAEPDLGRDSDVVVHLGLNDCARRMFLERTRIALQLLPPALSERMVDFSRKYRAQILRHAPPLYYTPPALFASNLDQIITLLKARGAGRIVLTTIILVPLKFWPYTPDVGLFMTEFNLSLMQVAHRHDVRVFDLDRQVWSEFHLGPLDRDGMHLSPHGHEVFAREVAKILGHTPPRPAAAVAGAPASAAMEGKDPSADLREGAGQPAPVAEDVRRIAILGTSNSIMTQGWTGLFKSVIPKSWTTTNFSIGGSNALFMSGQEAAHAISRTHDLCIIELPINDQRYIDSGYLKPEHFVAAVAGLFKGLMAPGSRCVPLVLLMSQRKTGTLENGADQTLAQLMRLCNAYSVPMFDVNDHIRKACAETMREYADFFADGLHLKPVVQRHVATALARMLTDGWPAMPQAQSDLLELAPAFGVVPARDFVAPAAPEMRKTSLAAMDLACLEHGERMQVHLTGHVCGLMHWADARSEEVVITALDGAQASVQKLLRKEWNSGIFFFTHIFSPIETRKGIEIRSGKNPKLPVEAAINASKLPGEEPPRTEIAFVLYSDRSLDESGRAIAARIKDVPARSPTAPDARLVRQLCIIALG